MKRAPILFLRAAIWLIALPAAGICFIALPMAAARDAVEHPETAHLIAPFLIGVYLLAAAFFVALYQALKIIARLDHGTIFTHGAVRALGVIKRCAVAIAGLMVLAVAFIAFGLDGDRAGLVSLGIMAIFGSCIVATFVAVLQRLLASIVALKSENDLTV